MRSFDFWYEAIILIELFHHHRDGQKPYQVGMAMTTTTATATTTAAAIRTPSEEDGHANTSSTSIPPPPNHYYYYYYLTFLAVSASGGNFSSSPFNHLNDTLGVNALASLHTMGKLNGLQKLCVTAIVSLRFTSAYHHPSVIGG